jgi:hypothetical protein
MGGFSKSRATAGARGLWVAIQRIGNFSGMDTSRDAHIPSLTDDTTQGKNFNRLFRMNKRV